MPNSAAALLCVAPAATRAAMARLRASCSLSLPLFFLVEAASIGMPCRLISLCTVVLLAPSRCAISPMDRPSLRNCRSSAIRCAGQEGGPRQGEEINTRTGGYRHDHRVAQAVLAQREAGDDTIDDGTITRLNLRGACG